LHKIKSLFNFYAFLHLRSRLIHNVYLHKFIKPINAIIYGEQKTSAGCKQLQNDKKQINFSGAFALYPLNLKWNEEYSKTHPDIVFNIQPGGAGKGLTDVLYGNADVGMFSREISDNELNKGVWYITLAKDAVFATISAKNPYLDSLIKRGITKEELKNIFIDGNRLTWENLSGIKGETEHKINVYTRSDASGAAESWAAYFNMHQEDIKGVA
jgi:phosphate transport system substrate-binding protein